MNFKPKELLHTNTGIDNTPDTFQHMMNLVFTANKLQYLRDRFGKPIIVNSGYRNSMVNKAVGGSNTSAHMKGLAADITSSDNEKLLKVVVEHMGELNVDQCIEYRNNAGKLIWIHIGWADGKPRQQRFTKKA